MNGFAEMTDETGGGFLFPMDNIEEPGTHDVSPSSIARGCISETLFKLECLKRGLMPFEPSHHDTKCDLVLLSGKGALIAIQVKRAYWDSGRWAISSHAGRDSEKYRSYTAKDFHFLAAHIPEGDVFCFWPVEFIAGRKKLSWRSGISPANNWEDLER